MADLHLSDGIALLQRRGKILQALLLSGLVLSLSLLIGQIGELNGWVSLDHDQFTPMDSLYAVAAVVHLLLQIITHVIFGMWIYRAAANVVAAQVSGFDYTPGWAVGWLFVPIANLFKPYAAMLQIDNASRGRDGHGLDQGNLLLRLWWGAWLISNIVGNISFRLSLRAETPAQIRSSLEADTATTATGLFLYPLAYLLVTRITQAQQERLNAAHIFA